MEYSWMDRPDVDPEDMPEEEFRKFTHPEPPTTKELTDKLHRLQGQLRGGLSREEFRRKYEGRQRSVQPRVVNTFSTASNSTLASRKEAYTGAGRNVRFNPRNQRPPRHPQATSKLMPPRHPQATSRPRGPRRPSVLPKPQKRSVSSSRSESSDSMWFRGGPNVKDSVYETGRITLGDMQYRKQSDGSTEAWKLARIGEKSRYMGAGPLNDTNKPPGFVSEDKSGFVMKDKDGRKHLVPWVSKDGNSSWPSKRSRRSMRAPKRSRSQRKTSKSKRNIKRSQKKTKRSSRRRR